MNKKLLIIIPLLIIVLMNIFIIYSKGKKIPTYDSDIVCSYTESESHDDDNYESTSIIYIYKDKNNVKKTINQSIMSNNSDMGFLESVKSLYDNVEGINASLNVIDENIIFEVVYDYDKIDLEEINEKLGNILSEDSILVSTKTLPIKVDTYIESLSDKYKCEGE